MIDKARDDELSEAIAYGWDGGKARAFAALLPYVSHLPLCFLAADDEPNDPDCTCGLRSVWRIRETPE